LYKPTKPIKSTVVDYRLHEKDPEGYEDDDGNVKECLFTLENVSVKQILDAYPEHTPEDLIVSYGHMPGEGNYRTLVVCRPESDEEFAKRLADYEKCLAVYEAKRRKKTPEEKEAIHKKSLTTQLARLEAKAAKLRDHLNNGEGTKE
jgi:hypothetical protein